MSSKWPASGTTWTVASGMRGPRIRALAGGTMGSSSWLCSSTLWPDSSATHGQVPRVAAPRGGATSRRAVRRARQSSRPPGLFVDRHPMRRPSRRSDGQGRVQAELTRPGVRLAAPQLSSPDTRRRLRRCATRSRTLLPVAAAECTVSAKPRRLVLEARPPRRVHRLILTDSREYWSRYEDFA